MKINNLRCEYRINPLGLDIRRPRLSWQIESDRTGVRQSAYRLIAAEDPAALSCMENLLWDSGVVKSAASIQIPYGGPALRSRQRLYWRVQVWDQTQQPLEWSPVAWFEMGLLKPQDWLARWIAADLVGDSKSAAPCPFLRKTFSLDREISTARLFITSLGLYRAVINGQRVSKDEFTPGWTDYHQRLQYQTYDVTRLLTTGANTIGVILGDGWYCGHVAWEGRQNYGDRPRLLAQLELHFVHGASQTIITDETWLTASGPIRGSDLIMGEAYDARLEENSWATAATLPEGGNQVMGWSPVLTFPPPENLTLVAQHAPPVRRQAELPPIANPQRVGEVKGACWIFDFGQNLVGFVRLQVAGQRGQRITLRFGEMLTDDGHLYTENLRSARQTDTYILRGDPGGECYEPHFTFHGFRYVEVSGLDEPPTHQLLTAIVLHSDNAPALRLETSHPPLNQLVHNITWGWKGNSLDVPTDCPQRDERLGWTGDAQVFVKTATYLSESAAFFTKWVQDLADAQFEYGAIPPFAPFVSTTHKGDGGPAWSDAFIIVPWTIWQQYGDTRILEIHYQAMCAYLDYLVANSPGLIRLLPDEKELGPGNQEGIGGYGDWLAMDGSADRRGATPRDLIGTAFLAYDACLMSQIAAALGKSTDAARFSDLFEDTRLAFQERFVHPDGSIAGDTQTAYILALHFDLLSERLRKAALAALVRDIESRDLHMSTGFVGTPYLLPVLSDRERLDLAYDLLLQKTFPSWLYSVLHGATTIWERWDGWTEENGFQDPGMNSFNHYAYGAVGAWMVESMAGICPDPAHPGFKHFFLKPLFPATFIDRSGVEITWAHADYTSPYGSIKSHWQRQSDGLIWEIRVPPNTTATASLPGVKADQVFESGRPIARVEGITTGEGQEGDLLIYLQPGAFTLTIPRAARE